jgi:phosphate transport system substrate-binding protein
VKLKRFGRLPAVAAVTVAGLLALTACGSDNETKTTNANAGAGSTGSSAASSANGDCAPGTINASGSSAQAIAMQQWITDYQTKCSGATVNYGSVGSGQGVQDFLSGQTAFAGSDSALKDDEHPKADARCKTGKAVDLPMVAGPVAITYSLPGVDGLTLTPSLIAKIFSGKITMWNDPAIAKVNSGVNLPSTKIATYHRSDASGTTDNFTKYLKASAGADWTYDAGKEWKAPGGQGAKGNEGIAAAIKQTPGAISYNEYGFAKANKLSFAKIDNGAGPVELTPDSVSKAVAAAKVVGQGDDLTLQLDYATKAAGAYPIVLVTYEITCTNGLPADQAKLVKSFLAYTASDAGQQKLVDLGYAPLPDEIRTKVAGVVDKIGA